MLMTPAGWPAAVAEFRFTVRGKPCTWQRKRLDARGRKPRTFTDASQKEAMEWLRLAAISAMGWDRAQWRLDGAFEVHAVGYWANAVVGDSDRLTSLSMDALEGVAYGKDRQVRGQSGYILADGSPERVEVLVRRLERDPVQPKARAKRKVAK